MPPDLFQSLSYQLAGVIIVLASLALLAVAVVLAGYVLRKTSEGTRVKPESKSQKTADGAQSPQEEIPAEIRVVIAAAVVAALDRSCHIVEITRATDVRLQAWSLEGRRQIFSSHHLR